MTPGKDRGGKASERSGVSEGGLPGGCGVVDGDCDGGQV